MLQFLQTNWELNSFIGLSSEPQIRCLGAWKKLKGYGDDAESIFKAPVKFNSDYDSLTLPAEAVDRRLPIGNPYLAHNSDQYTIKYLAGMGKNKIVQCVKGAIIDLPPHCLLSDDSYSQKCQVKKLRIP